MRSHEKENGVTMSLDIMKDDMILRLLAVVVCMDQSSLDPLSQGPFSPLPASVLCRYLQG